MIINWGDAPFKAFITVTYPAGTCTVTGEGQTYTHSGGGTKTFTVKKKGTYTASLVWGSLKDSASVSITKHSETKAVELVGWVYNSGTEIVALEVQKDVGNHNNGLGSVTKMSSHISIAIPNAYVGTGITSSSKINFGGAKTMYVTISSPYYYVSSLDAGLIVSLCASKTAYDYRARTNIVEKRIQESSMQATTYALSVPSGTTSAYIGVHLWGQWTSATPYTLVSCNVTKIWFE